MTTNPASICYDAVSRRLMCELCFEDVSFDDLYIDGDGERWDICAPCGKAEAHD